MANLPSMIGREAAPESAPRERRRKRRTKIPIPVRIRPENTGLGEEVAETSNASRKGLYFTTERNVYYAGMSVRFTFPYFACNRAVSGEAFGYVTRVEKLADSKWGVAIRTLLH